MKTFHISILATFIFGLVLGNTTQPATAMQNAKNSKISPAAYGLLPSISDAAISPDGKRVALLESEGGATFIAIYSLDTNADPVRVGVGKNKGRGLVWGGNDYVLVSVSASRTLEITSGLTTFEFFRYVSINANTGKSQFMFSKNKAFDFVLGDGQLLHRLPDNDEEVLFGQISPYTNTGGDKASASRLRTRNKGGWMVYTVNLRTGKEKITQQGAFETEQWIVNADGKTVFRVDYDEKSEKRNLYTVDKRKKSMVLSLNEKKNEASKYSLMGYSYDGQSLIAASTSRGDKYALYPMNPTTGKMGEPLLADQKYDVSSIQRDPDTGRVIGAIITEEFPKTIYFDPDFKGLVTSMKEALRSDAIFLQSFSRDRKRWIIRAVHDDRPSAYYLFERDTRQLSLLGSTYPWLKDIKTPREEYDYVTEDGFYINGYLTTPQGSTKKNLPLIVMPHGGPAARDDNAFDWWAAFYAARGYAVYQPNFRGSDGYGNRFRRAGARQWGRAMQNDVTEGLKKLIADGIVDKTRVCIVGASYGGYAALAGATLTPELYQCAISVNGVADLPGFLGQVSQGGSGSALSYWRGQIGSRFQDMKDIKAVSPVDQAKNTLAAVLLIHGRDDTVVPYNHSTRMRGALQSAKKTVEFVELKGEDHWLSNAETRTRMLDASINFIDKYIGH